MKPICILSAADTDFHLAYQQYEDQEPGKGDRFSDAVDAALALLRSYPLSGSHFLRRTRKMLIYKFPYALFYVVESDRIAIHSILDVRRDPDSILRRISEVD